MSSDGFLNDLAHPEPGSVPTERLAPTDGTRAALSAAKPSVSEDGGEVTLAPASPTVHLADPPPRAALGGIREGATRERGGRVQSDDCPPPPALVVSFGRVFDQAGKGEPVEPPLHALTVCTNEPGDRPLVPSVRHDPAHDRREPHDQLRDRARIAGGAGGPSPLLAAAAAPEVDGHRDTAALKPSIPGLCPSLAAAGAGDGGQDLDAARLCRRRESATERAPARASRGPKGGGGGDCHRQRRGRRSRRQSGIARPRPHRSAPGIRRSPPVSDSVRRGGTVPEVLCFRVAFVHPRRAMQDRPIAFDRVATRSFCV